MADEHHSAQEAKTVAFYSAVVQAWVATRMEKDRTLLSLSGGGVGLLATLLTTVGLSSSTELLLYVLAGSSFVCAIIVALRVLDRNSRYLEEVIKNGKNDDDPRLIMLDRCLWGLFLAGIILTGAIGILSGYNSIWRDPQMAQDNQKIPHATDARETTRSLSGIGSLAPQPTSPPPAGTSESQDSGSDPVAEGQAETTTVAGATGTPKE